MKFSQAPDDPPVGGDDEGLAGHRLRLASWVTSR